MAQKKGRNYLLDLLKVIFCIGVFLGHFGQLVGETYYGTVWLETSKYVGGALANGYNYFIPNSTLGVRGFSIAIFTFLTGYWMINNFKRDQAKNVLGRGKDLKVCTNYFWKTYAGTLATGPLP